MQPRHFGRTSLTVTPLGLGLAALGRPGYINLGHAEDLHRNYDPEVMEAHAHKVLDAAWQAGIRYFDAARSYGRAEDFLGSWLRRRQIHLSEVVIGSKWGYTYTANWQVRLPAGEKHEVKEHSLAVLQRQIQESRVRLNGYLQIYQIHSATLESGVLENQKVLSQLAQLRAEGLHIGLSVSGPQQAAVIEKALSIRRDGTHLFASVQATWNLLEQSAGNALMAAHQAGLGVIIKEALANGRLTTRNTQPDFAGKRAALETAAAARQVSSDALALAVAMQQPFADIVLSGAACTSHLQSNLRALTLRQDKSLAALLPVMREDAPLYWQIRARLDWN